MADSDVLDNLEILLASTNGLNCVGEYIRNLAVTGRLTANFEPSDSISELLSSSVLPFPVNSDSSEERFAIPDHWKWVPLSSIAEHQLGKMLNTSKMKGESRSYLRSVNIRQNASIDLSDLKEMLLPEIELEKYSVRLGDIFVNEGGDVGRSAIFNLETEHPLAFQNALHRLRPINGVLSEYIQLVLQQAKSQGVISSMSSGVTIQHFSASSIRRLAIPLPPTSEQVEIIKRVAELSSTCASLHENLVNSQKFSRAARRSAIDAISTAETLEELQTAWERISRNWEIIAGTTESIESLRELILDVLFKPKKIDEWEIRSFGDLLTISNGDRSKNYPSKEFRVSTGIPFVNAGHLKDGQIDLSEMDYISREKYESLSGGKFQDGDILFCLRGSLGKSALVKNFGEGTIASSLAIFRVGVEIDAEYLFWFLQSGMARLQIKKFDNGTAQPNLAAKSVLRFEIPLPKLSEQKSIVNKVADLMKICDQLQQKLIQKEEVADKFARSVVSVSA
jgi:type I restriction enzyme, S subunit